MTEKLLRAGGVVVGVLLGFGTGVWEVFLSPLYAGRVPLPVAPVLAILTNAGLVWFVYTIARRRGFALLPGVVWFVAMLIGATKTGDGDVLIPGNDWMGLATILAGGLAWGVAGYRLVLPTMGGPAGRPGSAAPAPRTAESTARTTAGKAAPSKAASARATSSKAAPDGTSPAEPEAGRATAPRPGARPGNRRPAKGRRR